MPGLDRTLVRARSVACYNDALRRLAEQGAAREDLGEATRRGIADVHCGDSWLDALERVYGLTARAEPVRPCGQEADEPWFGSPDVFLPFIHGCRNDRDTLIFATPSRVGAATSATCPGSRDAPRTELRWSLQPPEMLGPVPGRGAPALTSYGFEMSAWVDATVVRCSPETSRLSSFGETDR